jgi:hypothetical protein
MPAELYGRLQAAAGERSVGEEIRRRLEASFAGTPSAADPKTHALLSAVARIARELPHWYADWHADPFSFVAFRKAVDKVLMARRPAGDLERPEAKPNPEGLAVIVLHDEKNPEEVAGMLAGLALSAHAEGEE